MRHRQLVESYFAACTTGDADAIARHFCDDATIYDLNHDPVEGAATIGDFFVRVRERWLGASWEVNTYVGDGEVAAIEWTMWGSSREGPFAVRGSEHYEFRGDAIAQIRQYWIFDREGPQRGLRGFAYSSQERFAARPEGVGDASRGHV